MLCEDDEECLSLIMGVLILVLMEYALRGTTCCYNDYCRSVLILVLMEYALRVINILVIC